MSLTIVEHHARERLSEFDFGKTGCVVGMPPGDYNDKEVRYNGAQSCDGGDWPHLVRGVLLEMRDSLLTSTQGAVKVK